MTAKNNTKSVTPTTTEPTLMDEIGAINQASHIFINGHEMTIAWAGENTLHIRPAGFDEETERPFNYGQTEKNLCTALVTAWLSYANGAYPMAMPGLHLYRTWEDLKKVPGKVMPNAGILIAGTELPEEWASRLLSAPRQDEGVFEVDYVMGKLQIVKEMKNSTWTEGEYEGYGGPLHQRNTFWKHVALDMLLNGMAINVHYFPTTATRWAAPIMAPIDQPLNVRVAAAAQGIAEGTLKKTERRVHAFYAAQEAKGVDFKSTLREVKLISGEILTAEKMLGVDLLRWRGNNYIGHKTITAANIEESLTTIGTLKLRLAVNDGTWDVNTGLKKA